MTNRSEAFGRLLKAGISSIVNCEGKKAAIVEDELGQLIGISGDSIQRYKSGHLPPEDRAIEILAEAAVQRGYLGREWLQRFLHAARYPYADKLLDRLCPVGPARPRPPRVYHNLPAPTYSQFIMREQAFAEVREGLGKQSAIVLIVGLGGNGKTSLAREAAARCLQDGDNEPRFDAVVWVSDKDRPGTTNLSVVLDEIAWTLDYPGFTQFEHDEKRREVENLLRRQRALIVVDNFETITDGALLAWLQNLSEPSKALITAREYRREYRRGGWLVELRGMTDTEAHEFASERLHMLRIAQLVSDLALLEPLLVATGSNPKAIEIALGLVKHERRSLLQVVDDLYAARGDLFDDLFARAWALLDEAARRVLLVMTFFPTSASGEALAATADVQRFVFERTVERLTDLALIDEQRTDLASAPRYTLHPLVRAFAGAKVTEQPAFEEGARERWVGWYKMLAAAIWPAERFTHFRPELKNLLDVAMWLLDRNCLPDVGLLLHYCHDFFFAEGQWHALMYLVEQVAEWAETVHEPITLKAILRSYVNVARRQGRWQDVEVWADRVSKVAADTQDQLLDAEVKLSRARNVQRQSHFTHRYTLALEALEIFHAYGDHEGEVLTFNTLGNMFRRQKKFPEAYRYYKEGAKLVNSLGSIIPQSIAWGATISGNMALVDAQQGRIKEARDTLSHVLEEFTDQTDFAEAYASLALYEFHLNHIEKAYEYRRLADEIIERLHLKRPLCDEDAEWTRLDHSGNSDGYKLAHE
jgi:tetratricopeptide (TPR) repeat protein